MNWLMMFTWLATVRLLLPVLLELSIRSIGSFPLGVSVVCLPIFSGNIIVVWFKVCGTLLSWRYLSMILIVSVTFRH